MKQVILVRKDLKMNPGKLASQCAHSSVEAVLRSDKSLVKKWHSEGMKKVILRVNSKKELLEYRKKAEKEGLATAMITDSGKTFFKNATITCIAIGPDKEDKIDKVTKELKML